MTQGGSLVEDTYDWYAQDAQGNVWYLGEDTKEYENGKVVEHGGLLDGRGRRSAGRHRHAGGAAAWDGLPPGVLRGRG